MSTSGVNRRGKPAPHPPVPCTGSPQVDGSVDQATRLDDWRNAQVSR